MVCGCGLLKMINENKAMPILTVNNSLLHRQWSGELCENGPFNQTVGDATIEDASAEVSVEAIVCGV